MAHRDGNFSTFVSKTLDAIGYRWDTIQHRRQHAKYSERLENDGPMLHDSRTMYAGSQREGLCAPLASDDDFMIIREEVICTEDVPLFTNRSNLTVFELDIRNTPPGYASLKLCNHGGRFCPNHSFSELEKAILKHIFASCCVLSDNDTCISYLSSSKMRKAFSHLMQYGMDLIQKIPSSLSNLLSLKDRAGPSIPSFYDNNIFQMSQDNVFAIACHCPSVFESFRRRPRRHGWPPEHILQEISQLEAHVVPVGYKRSPYQSQEWRICFTQAEIRLIEFLTEPQIHVLVLLKIFAKEVLRDVWNQFTSYIMKNLILWMVELIPGHKFHKATVVDRFLDCLLFLRLCVKTRRLPNYMIAERNLLSNGTFFIKRKKILILLDDCIREKGSCLSRSHKLKEAMFKMHASPEEMGKAGIERDQFEIVMSAHIRYLKPHVSLTTSLQDLYRITKEFNGASPLEQFINERFTTDEINGDPFNVIRRLLEMVRSHLQ